MTGTYLEARFEKELPFNIRGRIQNLNLSWSTTIEIMKVIVVPRIKINLNELN